MQGKGHERRLIDCVCGFSPTLQAVIVMAAEDEQNRKSPLGRLSEAAFDALVRSLEAPATLFAENLLRDYKRSPSEGEALAYQAAFKLHKHGLHERRYDASRAPIECYYYAILRREVQNHGRRIDRSFSNVMDPATAGPDHLGSFVDLEELLAVINMLRDQDREMLLFLVNGFSPDDICEVLGLTKKEVYKRTFRARQAFRQLWNQRKRRQDDAAWLEALVDPDEAQRVIVFLPRMERTILEYLLKGYAIDEICDVTDVPRDRIHARIFAAKERFSELWDKRQR